MKKERCQLCGKSTGKVQLYCGGPWMHLHKECADIAEKAIRGYVARLLTGPFGLYTLAKEIIDVHEEIHNNDKL